MSRFDELKNAETSDEISRGLLDVLYDYTSFLKRRYHKKMFPTLFWLLAGAVVFTTISVLVDKLLPSTGWWWLCLRAVVLIPLSGFLFSLGYYLSLFGHFGLLKNHEGWRPLRDRLSFAWRVRVSIIVAAFALVLLYANSNSLATTFVNSGFVAVCVGLLVYVRRNREEQIMHDFDIPDERDIEYRANYSVLQAERAEVKRERKERRRRKRNKFWFGEEELNRKSKKSNNDSDSDGEVAGDGDGED